MKTLLLVLYFISLQITITLAQSLKKAVPENSKVYVVFPGNHPVKEALDRLTKWGYWQIVTDHKDADFIMKIVLIKSSDFFSGAYSAYAEFDDKTNFPVFTTSNVNMYSKDEAIKLLIHKRIIDGKNQR